MSPRHLLSILPALLAAVLLHAAPASAQVQLTDITCKGTVKQTWTPGLKVLPADVRYTNDTDFTECTSASTGITSGRIRVDATFNNSCLANIERVEAVIEWSDGSESSVSLLGIGVNVVGNLQVFTSLGRVTSGQFEGGLVSLTNAFAARDFLACLTPMGLRALQGRTALIINTPSLPTPLPLPQP
ncbi:hypothetical protein [Myxococcus fulvus]|uniref:hypothetical protein n=1 Tax=Myxococcus fulvus TaxID=33 RepID=UPI0020C0DF4C|nr:hypothetical protein [Myxococcus fulvus]MCK8496825.1 hypothetical protein [Myxococcus fulvus]